LVLAFKLGRHLVAILEYKLGSNLRHHLGRKWAWNIIFAPFPRLNFNFLKNLKCILLRLDERYFLKVRKRILCDMRFFFIADGTIRLISSLLVKMLNGVPLSLSSLASELARGAVQAPSRGLNALTFLFDLLKVLV
jgi:hypothetical protein